MCEIWTDHRWSAPRFVTSGRRAAMGRYNLYLVRCEICGRETTETHWFDLPVNKPVETRIRRETVGAT